MTKLNRTQYLRCLKIELGGGIFVNIIKAYVMRRYTHIFIFVLRTLEYHSKKTGIYHKMMKFFFLMKWKKWSVKTGISIPEGVCKEGLTLYHYGSIVVNRTSKIGRNCCIMNNVNIGANGGSKLAPIIGNDVYIGPGAVIYGAIKIADGCYIGANAVVNKSFLEPNSVIAGVPARVIKYDKTPWWVKNGQNRQ